MNSVGISFDFSNLVPRLILTNAVTTLIEIHHEQATHTFCGLHLNSEGLHRFLRVTLSLTEKYASLYLQPPFKILAAASSQTKTMTDESLKLCCSQVAVTEEGDRKGRCICISHQ